VERLRRGIVAKSLQRPSCAAARKPASLPTLAIQPFHPQTPRIIKPARTLVVGQARVQLSRDAPLHLRRQHAADLFWWR
jgi:hypothetical protein